MTNTLFLDALRAALKGEQVAWEQVLSNKQWQALYQQANAHHVLPLIFQSTANSPAAQHMDPRILLWAQRIITKKIALQIQKTDIFLDIYRKLREQGLCPILVKGVFCRHLYPDPDLRYSVDEDLLIGPEEFLSCHEALLRQGLQVADPNADIQQDYEVPYCRKGTPLYLELHKYLFPPESNAYGDLNRFFTIDSIQTTSLIANGTELITLAPNDHLFYLICHAYKHFIHCGFGLRQLCDIALLICHHGPVLNWEDLYHRCQEIHVETFVEAILKIARVHLAIEMDTTFWPAQWQQASVDESALLEDLLTAGIFGNTSLSRIHSSNMTLDAVSNAKQGSSSGYSLRTSLFPPRSYLKKQYGYLNQHPYLLPLAWVSRILTYSKKARRPGNSATEALNIGKERITLLRQYGIIP